MLFSTPWDFEMVYVFPPFPLIGQGAEGISQRKSQRNTNYPQLPRRPQYLQIIVQSSLPHLRSPSEKVSCLQHPNCKIIPLTCILKGHAWKSWASKANSLQLVSAARPVTRGTTGNCSCQHIWHSAVTNPVIRLHTYLKSTSELIAWSTPQPSLCKSLSHKIKY